ncbi:MAG: ATP-binding protein [Lachnospiraceae bacterium]|nr:ATP-binding protein [Lachnospiraceae bacterium]
MIKKTGKKERDMIAGMFFSAALALIFTQVAGVVATIIDGIITSRYLGKDAYSAVSLLSPFTGTLVLLAGFISTGCQVVCAQMIGNGKKEEANKVFSFSVFLTALLCVLMIAGCILFPGQLIAVCGVSTAKNQAIYPEMLNYLHGYMLGIPALMMIQVVGPMVVMDGGKKLFSMSAAFLCIVDIIGDIMNALVFKGGNFGMGMATSIALFLQLLTILAHFFMKKGYFRFSFKDCSFKWFKDIARAGSPTFVRKLATVLRDLLINRMNLAVALSTAAVAARGMQNDLNTLMFCIGLGIGKTLLSMTGIYYGAYDKKGLKRLFVVAARTGILLSGGAGLICFLCAGLIARGYTSDPEVIELSVFSIRCMALSLVLDTLLVSFQNYLQGIGNRKLVNLMNFGERLFVPVLTAFFMGRFFGSKGIMASIAVSKVLLAVMMLIVVGIRCRRFPRSFEDYMFLPEGFGGDDSDNCDALLYDMEDVMRESRMAEEFCLGHGIDKTKARWMALFVEEMAGNIVKHGKPRRKGSICVDYKLVISGDRVCLCLRDYCEFFDPTEYYEAHRDSNADENIGIKMVMGHAKEVQYYYTFNSNNLLLYMD